MTKKSSVATRLAPVPKGPYSQAVIAGEFVFVAGQGPVDPASGNLVLGDIRSECELTLKNIEAILQASGTTLNNVVRCSVYLADINDFEPMNEVYSRFFPQNPPARTTIGTGSLLGGIKVEIDVVAFLENKKRWYARPRPAPRTSKRSKK